LTSIWTYAGVPVITIPGATINNMPLDFQCLGTYGKDESLLTWVKEIEAVLNGN
jgi:Asp-tRNA(Asn)/Glu-tRNA(Gln) amidotransferase A subunit family amidase